MKNSSKKTVKQIKAVKCNVISKAKMNHLKGGSDGIGVQEVVDG